jgi:hypothetical protein
LQCIFNFELSLIDFFSSTEVEKSVLYIFCNNIFLKKVTLEKPYGVSGVVDGDTGNRSNERFPIFLKFVSWKFLK